MKIYFNKREKIKKRYFENNYELKINYSQKRINLYNRKEVFPKFYFKFVLNIIKKHGLEAKLNKLIEKTFFNIKKLLVENNTIIWLVENPNELKFFNLNKKEENNQIIDQNLTEEEQKLKLQNKKKLTLYEREPNMEDNPYVDNIASPYSDFLFRKLNTKHYLIKNVDNNNPIKNQSIKNKKLLNNKLLDPFFRNKFKNKLIEILKLKLMKVKKPDWQEAHIIHSKNIIHNEKKKLKNFKLENELLKLKIKDIEKFNITNSKKIDINYSFKDLSINEKRIKESIKKIEKGKKLKNKYNINIYKIKKRNKKIRNEIFNLIVKLMEKNEELLNEILKMRWFRKNRVIKKILKDIDFVYQITESKKSVFMKKGYTKTLFNKMFKITKLVEFKEVIFSRHYLNNLGFFF